MSSLKKIAVFVLTCSVLFVYANSKSIRLSVISTLPDRPDGAFVRLTPDKSFYLFAVGSAAYGANADEKEKLRAEKKAALLAKTELIKFIDQNISSSEKVSSIHKQLQLESENNKNKKQHALNMSESEFVSSFSASAERLQKGIVMIKALSLPRKKGGVIKVLVGTSPLTRNIAALLDEGEKTSSPEKNVQTPKTAAVQTPPTAVVAPASAEEWLTCVGKGLDRAEAVKAALLEGIQQVYGVYLADKAQIKERFESLKSGKLNLQTEHSESSQETFSQTRGFIREYRIISVEKHGKSIVATIKAKIVSPRAGGIRTVMLYPMKISAEKEVINYNAGPELRRSGLEIARLCSTSFERAFNADNSFKVLNPRDLKKVISQQELAGLMVKSGHALPLELAKTGQLLGADYIFVPEFEELAYSRKIKYNAKAKKFMPEIKFSLSFNYRLVDVRTGTQLKNEKCTVFVTNDDLKSPANDGDPAEMLNILIDKAVAHLSQQMNK